MGRAIVRFVALAAITAAGAPPLAGQGSSVSTQGACSSARAGAAVAAPCEDASSVFYNPAALATMPTAFTAGFTAIYNKGSFLYDSTGVEVEREPSMPVVPHVFASYRFAERWAAAFGFFAPYGLGLEWPDDFEGRFIASKSSMEGLYFQPTVAWQAIPGRLSIGGGIDIVRGALEINRSLDAPLENVQLAFAGVPLGTDFARAKLEGTGWGVGAQIGAYWTPSDRLAVGARYMHEVTVDLEGTADFEQVETGFVLIMPDGPVLLDDLVAPQFAPGAALADQGATASITLPPQAVLGVRVGATDRAAVSADYQWTGWTTFDRITAEFENGESLRLPLDYENTHTIRIGGDYEATGDLDLRAGFIYNTPAAPNASVTPVLPEAERHLYTVGAGYRFGMLRADAFYNFVRQADRRGRVRSRLLLTEDPDILNVGVYSSDAHLFGVTLTYLPGGGR